jgi:predicted nuclease of predicted toxin-antitoxin system
MKLLVDACVAETVVQALRAHGHDVAAVVDWPRDPGDEEILRLAAAEQRTIVTRDKDFGTLAVLYQRGHAGILQLRRLPLREQPPACVAALHAHAQDLETGAIVTVLPGRLRVRRRGTQ